MDYGYPERRKSKSDKRAKGRYQRYKKGGSQRSANIPARGDESRRER